MTLNVMKSARTLPNKAQCREPIDMAHLARFSMGDHDLEREVLGLFIDQAPIYLEDLQKAPTDDEWHRAAHTLKGSAGAVGAWAVWDAAVKAEALRSDYTLDQRRGALKTLDEAIGAVADHIAKLFAAS